MLKSYKTLFLGIAGLIALGYKIYNHGYDAMTDSVLLTTALGNIFSKDFNATGGAR